jgi:hypothetical protein
MKIPLKRYGKLLVKYLRNQKGGLLLTVVMLTSIGLQIFIPQITHISG